MMGSINDLSPVWYQAMTWSNADYLPELHKTTNFYSMNQNTQISFQEIIFYLNDVSEVSSM